MFTFHIEHKCFLGTVVSAALFIIWGVHFCKLNPLFDYCSNGISAESTKSFTSPIAVIKRHPSLPHILVEKVSCSALISGDKNETKKAKLIQQEPRKQISDKNYLNMTANCEHFKITRQYVTEPLSTEEAQFPIAYSILIYKDTEQFERLLRAIYHPQNYYCVHIDAKAQDSVHQAVTAIAKCFDNVFLASKLVSVQWGKWSVLEADLICIKDLLKKKKWKYFINLTGQEFPLKTNLDLVRILQVFNGTNNIDCSIKRLNKGRYKGKSPTPHNITLTKGSVHIAASRDFVYFLINHPIAQDFANWLRNTYIPDEKFFSSLNYNPHLNIPGAYKGERGTDPEKIPFITRFKNWGNYPCAGKRCRGICIFAVGDLQLLASRPELFANKFHLNFHHFALDCMEELHYNRTWNQVNNIDDGHLDIDYYKRLDFVKNHVFK